MKMIMATIQRTRSAFALPTILIAATVLLIILTVAMTASTSVNTALRNVYYQQIAREAAESGVTHATACLSVASTVPWNTSTNVLVPSSSCSGTAKASAPLCTATNNSVLRTATLCTSYTVVSVDSTSGGPPFRVNVVGRTDTLRSNGSVAATTTSEVNQLIRYQTQPSLAGGAGWKDSEQHNGYMLSPDGTLYGWGGNADGQVQTPSGGIVTVPVKMSLPAGGTKVNKIANAGQGATSLCAIIQTTSSGPQVYCRGSGFNLDISGDWKRFPLTAGLTAQDVKISGYGSDAICVLASDSQLYCAGFNDAGGLGAGPASAVPVSYNSPVQFNIKRINTSLTVKQFYVQDFTTCVIASDNNAYCAGRNDTGQLGNGNATTNKWLGQAWPVKANMPGSLTVSNISLPYHNGSADGVFFYGSDSKWYMAGNNIAGTAGDGAVGAPLGACSYNSGWRANCYATPRALNGVVANSMISIGEGGQSNRHTICIISDVSNGPSDVWCMGSNQYGQMGVGNCNDTGSWAAPTITDDGGNVIRFSTAGRNYKPSMLYQMNAVYLLAPTGDLYAAGDNSLGKLGVTSNSSGANCASTSNATFKRVQMPAGVKVVDFSATDEYTTYILGSDNRIYSVGGNVFGQLGDGTTNGSTNVKPVALPTQSIIY